jgi:VWFA-related protein
MSRAPFSVGSSPPMSRHFIGLVVAVALFAIVVDGQNPPPPSPPASQAPAPSKPALQVTTRFIQVDAVVLDRDDVPVKGLTQADFTILENGVPQPISYFSAESPAARVADSVALPPGTFSNRVRNQAGSPTNLTVIVLDGVNTYYMNHDYVKKQVISFLSTLQPTDRVALYGIGRTTIWVLHDFTSNAADLLRTIQENSGKKGPSIDGSRGFDEFLVDANVMTNRVPAYARGTNTRSGNALNALEVIANHLASIPGRKNIIWVSGSFPIQTGGMSPFSTRGSNPRNTFESAIAAAMRVITNDEVAIYPVDTHGLAGFAAPPQNRLNGNSLQTMQQIAGMTGGVAYFNTNSIGGAIRRAIDDAGAAYELGYYPLNTTADGKFRQITVKVNRPGMHVRSRRGYFAFSSYIPDQERRKKALEQAAWSPLDAAALGLNARVTRETDEGAPKLKVELTVDPRDISFVQDNNSSRAALDLLFLYQTPTGRKTVGDNISFNLKFTPDQYAQFQRDGLTATKTLDLSPDAVSLRIILRDANTGMVGSLIVPLNEVQ